MPTTSGSLASVQVSDVRTAARVRGPGVGAVSSTLAVAAHATGGAMPPDATALLLLLGLGTALGAASTTVAGLRSARLGLLALLGAGQLAAHLLLEVSAMHAHVPPSPTMLAAHAGAVVVAAVLIGLAERVGPACAAALARVLPVLLVPLVVRPHPAPLPAPVTSPTIRQLLVTTSLARRGPPVGA